MKVMEGSTRTAFLCFFISHIPITLFIDSQGLFGPYYPKFLTDLVAWYCDLFGDILMKNVPSIEYAWFSSLIVCEVFFQLPFFFVAVKFIVGAGGFHNEKNSSKSQIQHYPEWFRTACIIYGTHVSTTLVPIIAAFATSSKMTMQQKCVTVAIYSPYLIFPLWLIWLAVLDDFVDTSHSRIATKGTPGTKLD